MNAIVSSVLAGLLGLAPMHYVTNLHHARKSCDGIDATASVSALRTTAVDSRVLQIMDDRIAYEGEGDGVGIVVGLVSHTESRVYRYAKFHRLDPRGERALTVYKLGSVTSSAPRLYFPDVAAAVHATRPSRPAHSWMPSPCLPDGLRAASVDVIAGLNAFISAETKDDKGVGHPIAVLFETQPVARHIEDRPESSFLTGRSARDFGTPAAAFSCTFAFDAAQGLGLVVLTNSKEGSHFIATRLLTPADASASL